MPKFYGNIGYGHSAETEPGVYEDVITERPYYGDVIRNSRRLQNDSEKLNYDITINNSISIVSDAYADEHFFAIRFVEWAGVAWTVETVTVERPRLILDLGGVYNGKRAS